MGIHFASFVLLSLAIRAGLLGDKRKCQQKKAVLQSVDPA